MNKYYVGLNKTFIKLKISKESTIVDEKNNRVIHIINWELEIPGLMDDFFWNMIKDCNTYKLCGRAKGVAVCHPEDKFNPEIGKKLARAIAESNAYHNAATRIRKHLRQLNIIFNQIFNIGLDFIIKADDIKIHNKKYQDSLIK
ncbi:MAG: hypothetical protein J6Y02_10275 [Pseudobutyrivibrio sp.]|nr:hypothetical protein [Pseudobutyrivibrio sp.]